MIAKIGDVVIAESNECIEIEGNQYFPPGSVKREYLQESDHTTTCPWKGVASYYNIVVGDETFENAAWYYSDPMQGAPEKVGKDFSNFVAFYTDKVEIVV
ncbi:MAG: DUF427 domain-containing protein [Candidatus Dojkabacteria bacterium]